MRAEGAPDLHDAILDSAEMHFAKRGYDAVSTRAVARDVGATAAMIHYYFKSKRQLFDAVVARRADVINKERMDALDAYEKAAKGEPKLEGAISAFLGPVMTRLEQGEPGWRYYFELIAQIGNKHDWGGEVMTNSFDPVIQRMMEIIRKVLPDATEENLYWSYHFLSGALLLTISETDRIDRLSGGICQSTDIASATPRLVEFAAAGFMRICKPQGDVS